MLFEVTHTGLSCINIFAVLAKTRRLFTLNMKGNCHCILYPAFKQQRSQLECCGQLMHLHFKKLLLRHMSCECCNSPPFHAWSHFSSSVLLAQANNGEVTCMEPGLVLSILIHVDLSKKYS